MNACDSDDSLKQCGGDRLPCERVQSLLALLVVGELDAAAAAEVRRHLEQCPECAAAAERLQRAAAALSEAFRHASTPGLSPEARSNIESAAAAIRAAGRGTVSVERRGRMLWVLRSPRRLAAVAAAVLFVLGIWHVLLRPRTGASLRSRTKTGKIVQVARDTPLSRRMDAEKPPAETDERTVRLKRLSLKKPPSSEPSRAARVPAGRVASSRPPSTAPIPAAPMPGGAAGKASRGGTGEAADSKRLSRGRASPAGIALSEAARAREGARAFCRKESESRVPAGPEFVARSGLKGEVRGVEGAREGRPAVAFVWEAKAKGRERAKPVAEQLPQGLGAAPVTEAPAEPGAAGDAGRRSGPGGTRGFGSAVTMEQRTLGKPLSVRRPGAEAFERPAGGARVLAAPLETGNRGGSGRGLLPWRTSAESETVRLRMRPATDCAPDLETPAEVTRATLAACMAPEQLLARFGTLWETRALESTAHGDGLRPQVAAVAGSSPFFKQGKVLLISAKAAAALGNDAANAVHLIVVLDASGSMADGGRLALARSFVLEFVRMLEKSDRVSLVSAGIAARTLLRSAPPDAEEVGRLLNNLRTSGPIDLRDAVRVACELRNPQEKPPRFPHIVFVTDGSAEEDLAAFQECERLLAGSSRTGGNFHAVLVGRAPEEDLVAALVRHAGGVCLHVRNSGQASSRAEALVAAIRYPPDGVRLTVTFPAKYVKRWRLVAAQPVIVARYRRNTGQRSEARGMWEGSALFVYERKAENEDAKDGKDDPPIRVVIQDGRKQPATTAEAVWIDGKNARLVLQAAACAARIGEIATANPPDPVAEIKRTATELSGLLRRNPDWQRGRELRNLLFRLESFYRN